MASTLAPRLYKSLRRKSLRRKNLRRKILCLYGSRNRGSRRYGCRSVRRLAFDLRRGPRTWEARSL